MILDNTVSVYKGIAVFQPVINGVGGNLVAVQASRLSTWLHQRSQLGDGLPEEAGSRVCVSPVSIFCAAGIHAKTARVLLLLVICNFNYFLSKLSILNIFINYFTGSAWSCHFLLGNLLPSSRPHQPHGCFFLNLFIRRFPSSITICIQIAVQEITNFFVIVL